MAHLNQMARCQISTLFVSNQDGIAVPAIRDPINTNYWDRGRRVGSEVTRDICANRRNDQQACNVIGTQLANVRSLFRRIIICVAEDHAEGSLVGNVLYAPNHAREEWIRDVG